MSKWWYEEANVPFYFNNFELGQTMTCMWHSIRHPWKIKHVDFLNRVLFWNFWTDLWGLLKNRTLFMCITLIYFRVDETKSYDFFTRIKIPHIRIEGIYNLRGKILLVPLLGRGKCWFEPSRWFLNSLVGYICIYISFLNHVMQGMKVDY